ncbi:MAG: TonB-dependent receptor [Calditrichaeota bacterium]|nr:TonB-dependent receptor [Calditrichota bacterium]
MRHTFLKTTLVFILGVLVTCLLAGTTGKIVGTVVDKQTGEPLVGVNIRLLNTHLGASTDLDGQFLILNVPPGVYDVEVSMLGYKTIVQKDVKVSIDLTTRLTFQLEEAPIEGEEVVVVAERPLIRKDITSRQSYIGSKEIIDLPVSDFKAVLSLQAGIIKDAAGRLHIRGGRQGEIAFLIDGVYMDDPLQGGFGSELQESNQARQAMSANLGILISDDAIDEMVVISGTFNAEYGNVMSGVVNIVTREPSPTYTGRLEFTSDYVNRSPYRRPNALVEDKNPIVDALSGKRLFYSPPENLQGFPTRLPFAGQFQGSFSGPVPGVPHLSFFFSGKYANLNSHLPHGFDLQRSYFTKLTYYLSPTFKINFTENFSRRIFQIYDHAWKYLPQNQGLNWLTQRRHIFTITHTISPRAFYILNVGLSDQRSEFGVWNWKENRFADPETEYEKGERDNELEFYVRGTDDLYLLSTSRVFSIKGDLNYQAGMHHEFKTGFEIKAHDLSTYKRIEPWPEQGGANRTIAFDKQPLEAAFYIQDKIEYDYIIINAGLRLDYVDVRAERWREIDNPLSGLVKASPRYQLSPRLGMALPISENTVFHFSYGHFFQFPSYADVYTNLVYQNPEIMSREAFVIVGNPGVEPQKTVAYEAGLKFQLGNSSALDVTAYFKDLTNLLGTRFYRRQLIYRYSVFTNIDYGSVKGIDFSWRYFYAPYLQLNVNYTYSVATGNSSFPTDQAYNAYFQLEEAHQEYPLDFDQRHNISASIILTYPRREGASMWERWLLSNTNLSVIIQYASGFPYTPVTDDPTLFIKPNSARMPWTGTVDLRLEKRWNFMGSQWGVFTEITNLFDRLNVLRVQPYTGRIWDTGKLDLLATGTDYVHDPSDAGPPRLIRLGAVVQF